MSENPVSRQVATAPTNAALKHASAKRPPRLVAFDVDGTLLRGRTICERIADGLGELGEMLEFERLTAREHARLHAQSRVPGDRAPLHALDRAIVDHTRPFASA
jgi:phosphoserine phosphatase